jgi:HK97 family phage major capsid protein
MTISTEELLQKATLTTADFDPTNPGAAPLTIEQATSFIELLAANQAFLPDVRTVMSNSSKWSEALIDFGGRITKPGVEATRLLNADRVKPTTGAIDISTVLLRAEVPVSDETMEDNIARAGFAGQLERLIADQFGFDIEELMVNGDADSTDPYLALLDGWLKQAQAAAGNVLDASGASDPSDFQALFGQLLNSIPNRFKRNLTGDWRFYVPVVLEEIYRAKLANRQTSLGDVSLTGTGAVTYQGIPLKSAASLGVANDDTSYILLANRNNLIAGFRRAITIESFRDPREGATSFVCTARVDAKVGIPQATAIATGVNVDPTFTAS